MERCIQDLGAGISFLRARATSASCSRQLRRRLARRLLPVAGRAPDRRRYARRARDRNIERKTCRRSTPLPCAPRIRAARRSSPTGSIPRWWMKPTCSPPIPSSTCTTRATVLPMTEWLARYRAAQLARNERITDRALERLRAFDANKDPDAPKDAAFLVFRTAADPRFMDLALDRAIARPAPLGACPRVELRRAAHRPHLQPALVALAMERAPVARRRPEMPRQDQLPVLSVLYSAEPSYFRARSRNGKGRAGPGERNTR